VVLVIKRMLGAISALAVIAVPAVTPAAQADVDIDEAVTDSMIYLQITFTGAVLVPGEHMKSGKNAWSPPVDVGFNCSGFVVDPSGFIGTAGHCVEIDFAVRNDLRSSALHALFEEGELGAADPAVLAETAATEQWQVQGPNPESEVARKVEVIQPQGPGRQIDQWSTAKLVDFQRFDDGDNALLKLAGYPPLKPLVIAEITPEVGDAITSVGFPGNIEDEGFVDPGRIQQPSFKTGTVSSHQVQPTGAPTLEINAQVSSGMSGGPTVDERGHVVGVNSFGVGEETHGFEFITDTQALRSLLQRNGVRLAAEVAPPEEKSFPWPWVIVAIVVVAAAGLVAAVLLRPKWFGLRRRGKTRRRLRPRRRSAPKELDSAPTTIDAGTAPPTDTKETPPKA